MVTLSRLPAGLLLLSTMLLGGCGYTQNVRAYRAYAYESPSLDVALDRTEDLAASLELIDQLLTRTPLSPEDAWVGRLALSDEGARAIRAELRQKPPYDANNSYEIPVVKVYRVHLERVLEEAKSGGSKYPSLLDAVGALGGGSNNFKAHWAAYYEKRQSLEVAEAAYQKAMKAAYPPGSTRNPLSEPESVREASKVRSDAKDAARDAEKALERDIDAIKQGGGDGGDRVALLKATTAGVSVAYRIELEALAMLPIIAVQAARSLPGAANELSSKPTTAMRGVSKLADVPDHIDSIKERMKEQVRLLDLLTEALAAAARTSVSATAGFALRDSVVDQVVGVTADSFRAQAKAGGEAFFFNALKQDDKSENKQGDKTIRKDLTGRLRTLSYDVKPILLTAFNLNLGFDYIKLPNAVGLNFGYKTDRVFSSGGTVDNSGSFAQQLGVSGVASDALDLGLGVLGVKTSVRVARFTTGTVSYADAAGNQLNDADGNPIKAPLRINFTQVDIGYDIAFLLGESAGKYYIEELTVGGRYFKYELPRILYELEVTNPSDTLEEQVYKNESSPQNVSSLYYMGGVTARFGRGDAPVFSPYGELGIYLGGGPTSYRLRQNKAVECSGNTTPAKGEECVDDPNPSDKNADATSASAFAIDASLALGARVRLIKPGRRFRLNGEVLVRGELIYANAKSSFTDDGGKSTQIDFGSADFFWGPRFNLVGEF